jgi:hypothetical protein
MSVFSRPWSLAILGTIGIPFFLLSLRGMGREVGQPAEAKQPAPGAGDAAKGHYMGVRSCVRCHREWKKDPDFPDEDYTTDFVLLTEYTTWRSRDKHSRAYAVLTEPLAKNMGRLLGGWNVAEDARCLNCHAAHVPPALRAEGFNIKDGVSCDACHGPAEKWYARHQEQMTWRKTPIADKEALGMLNVRDPVQRTEMCLSCHAGSVKEGKVVTHDMYAAGHPPLPSIEVAFFSDEMPRHWRYIKEKTRAQPELKDLYRNVLKIDPDELEKTKLVALGGVVALRTSMQMLEDQSDETHYPQPELAAYECYACHHDLKYPSWRQQRGNKGRPAMREWPAALVEAALGLAADSELSRRFQDEQRQLRQAFDARPFGDRKQIAAHAHQLAGLCDSLLAHLRKTTFDAKVARTLLRELCSFQAGAAPDYDSARQRAWAFEMIYGELHSRPPEKEKEPWKDLNAVLKLDLPSGNRKILDELPAGQRKLYDYDPDKFREAMEGLKAALDRPAAAD